MSRGYREEDYDIDTDPNVTTIDVELKNETKGAWLVVSVDTEKEAWVPKSKSRWEPALDRVSGKLTLPEWMAEEKELV